MIWIARGWDDALKESSRDGPCKGQRARTEVMDRDMGVGMRNLSERGGGMGWEEEGW